MQELKAKALDKNICRFSAFCVLKFLVREGDEYRRCANRAETQLRGACNACLIGTISAPWADEITA